METFSPLGLASQIIKSAYYRRKPSNISFVVLGEIVPLVSMSLVSPHLNSNHEWAEVTLILIIEKKDLSFTYFGMNTFMKILYNFSVSRATDMDWTGHSHSKGGIELHFMNVNHDNNDRVHRCHQPGCDSLVRPHVVWFGESLESKVLLKTDEILETCDFCIIVRH